MGNPDLVMGGTTTADCAKVTAAIAETELRLDPAEQCDWQPLLAARGGPALSCGTGTHHEDHLHGGLRGRARRLDPGRGGRRPRHFTRASPGRLPTHAPAGHAGGVAFGPDPVSGNCGAPGDLTSRNGLISPGHHGPRGTTPRISFEHYMASEATWDGGNVKVSVNGGAFGLVPDDAYLFNAPAGELDVDAGPMGGESCLDRHRRRSAERFVGHLRDRPEQGCRGRSLGQVQVRHGS